MALFQMNFTSASLRRGVSVNVFMPEPAKVQKPCRVLYLLHGLSDDHTAWMRYTAIERYAKTHGLAVIMPDVGRSWYTDTAAGANYFTFVAEELPKVCQTYFGCLSQKREDTWVGGISMGGYGAMKLALTYPHRYGAVVSLSGALDIADSTRNRPMDEWRGIFGFDLKDPSQLRDTKHDVFALAKSNRAEGKTFPAMYLWCGEEDACHGYSETFHALLEQLQVEHLYESSPGKHAWNYWDTYIEKALGYLSDIIPENE